MLRNLDDFSASRLQNYAVERRILTSVFPVFSLTDCMAHFMLGERHTLYVHGIGIFGKCCMVKMGGFCYTEGVEKFWDVWRYRV